MRLISKFIIIIFLLFPICLLINSCEDRNCSNKLICTNCPNDIDNAFGKTFFSYRPITSNTARKIIALEDKIHLFEKEDFYGVIDATFEYTKSFKSEKIGKNFSFVKDSNSMSYGPECGNFDIFGLYFGTNGQGTICFNPKIENYIANLDFFFGLNQFICGLWTRLSIPINHTRWDLRLSDNSTINSSTTLPYENLKEAWVGDKSWTSNGLAVNKLHSGKINEIRSVTEVAGIIFDLGYDFVSKEKGHLAIGIHTVAPTGTRPEGEFLFEAISGANHSWQLGITIDAGYRLWQNCDCDKSLNLFFDAEISHLFKSKQKRILGISKNEAGDSWLLLNKYVNGNINSIERTANILNTQIKVGSTIMVDASLMVQYNNGGFFSELGYNFWIRSKEKAKDPQIKLEEDSFAIWTPASLGETPPLPPQERWSCCNVNCIRNLDPEGCGASGSFCCKRQSFDTQSQCQAFCSGVPGTNSCCSFIPSFSSSTISGRAITKSSKGSGQKALGNSNSTIGNCAESDQKIIFIKKNDIDVCQALTPRSMSHKIFGNIGYNWKENDLKPFLSLFGEIEFANENTAVNQWGIGLKCGINF